MRKQKIIQSVVVGAVLGFIIAFSPYLLFAQQNPTEAENAAADAAATSSSSPTSLTEMGEVVDDCRVLLKPFIARQEKEFKDFIQQTFVNKSDTSALVDLGVSRYQIFRKNILDYFQKMASSYASNLTEELEKQQVCNQMVQDSLSTAEELLKKHVLSNSQSKKTTKLVTKLKEINEKLSKLQMETALMKAYFESFDNKLPCFVSKCIN